MKKFKVFAIFAVIVGVAVTAFAVCVGEGKVK